MAQLGIQFIQPPGTPFHSHTCRKKERTTALVVSAVLNGFRAIDTACQPKHYREDLVGNALEELNVKHGISRENIFLQTKFTSLSGQDRSLPLPYNPSDDVTTQVRASFNKSLENLKTNYFDSYILHSPLRNIASTLDAWKVLMSLQDEGKVRMIGVSNTYDVGVLQALSELRKVQVVQNRWFEGNAWDVDVFQYCRAHDIQYQSFWTLSGSPALLSHPSVLAISEMTPAQVVFGLAQSLGIVPLSGTTNEVHMKEDLAVGPDVFSADESRVQDIKRMMGLDSVL
ncbi:NADP-dependent oxidoreductase domain-containing protein [Mucidula mucida]|nr:NADP-dependent oxidoreductase domain-containing protein [Mucidula mucida]